MKHEIKTMSDVLKAVNPENVDRFLKDFSAWLGFTLIVRGLSDAMKVDNVGDVKDQEGFTWIDDGKHDAKITFEITQEEKPK